MAPVPPALFRFFDTQVAVRSMPSAALRPGLFGWQRRDVADDEDEAAHDHEGHDPRQRSRIGEVKKEQLDHGRRKQRGSEPPFGAAPRAGREEHRDQGSGSPDHGQQGLEHSGRQERTGLKRHVAIVMGRTGENAVQRHEAEDAERAPAGFARPSAGVRQGPLDEDAEREYLHELDGVQEGNIGQRVRIARMEAGCQHPACGSDHQRELPDAKIGLPKAPDRPPKESPERHERH